MEIKPITLRQASDLVNKNHRHHKATVGHKFSIGLFDGDRMTFAAEEIGKKVTSDDIQTCICWICNHVYYWRTF